MLRWNLLQAAEFELIITDHHDLPPALPEAVAVVNPKRLPEGHPLGTLPGVGVAYQLAAALFEATGSPGQAEQFLDLVALGIVADLALLHGDARYLLQRGLPALRSTGRKGLQALFEFAELDPTGLTEEHIGFGIGPRLNALGRLADANLAVEFLTTQDLSRARVIAMQLEGFNAQRQLQTEQVFQAACDQVARDPTLLEPAALVLSNPTWPAGVIGIVASRLVERYRRPAVLIAAPTGEIARGSARSVEGCNITAAIAAQADMLLNFGGHPMAAGLAILPERIPDFRRALSKTVAAMLGEAQLEPSLQLDGELPPAELSLDLVADLERLAPFGAGNPPLTLAARRLRMKSQTLIGRHNEHRQLIVEDEGEMSYKLIWWGGGTWPLPEWIESGVFDLAYSARTSNYRGQPEVQIEWIDAQPAEGQAIEVMTKPVIAIQDYRHAHTSPAGFAAAAGRGRCAGVGRRGGAPEAGSGGNHRRRSACPRARTSAGDLDDSPGWEELQAALAAVNPQTIYLFAIEPETGVPERFLERLAGLVKYALNAKQGRVNLAAMAAAVAQSESAVRAGLAWLHSRGTCCDSGPIWRAMAAWSGGRPRAAGCSRAARQGEGSAGRIRCLPRLLSTVGR